MLPRTGKEELYNRQEGIGLWIPRSALVVGLGGVGSWVALDLAMVGVEKLTLVDPDEVELSNLNRCPYREDQVGEAKAVAMAELILERRSHVDVDVRPVVVEKAKLTGEQFDVVMDCRDTSTALPRGLQEKVKVTGGYDGSSITLHLNPRPGTVWGAGRSGGYRTVPSWVVPPQLIASLLVGTVTSCRELVEQGEEKVVSFKVEELVKALFS